MGEIVLVKRKEVDWNKANCKGLDTNLFFTPMADLLEMGLSYRTLRRICFSCPIWKECLQVAIQEEPYGFWGGLSEEERRHLYNNTQPRGMKQLNMDLKICEVSLNNVIKVVKSVKRNFAYSAVSQK